LSDNAYAGDVEPSEVWDALSSNPDAVLVDVRTEAEWAWVGLVDLSSIGKSPILAAWKIYPGMELNEHFIAQVEERGVSADTPIYFMCRSGVRSIAAATAMTEAGYTRCYNMTEGFEGDCDDSDHRGTLGGWKVAGLPWLQK